MEEKIFSLFTHGYTERQVCRATKLSLNVIKKYRRKWVHMPIREDKLMENKSEQKTTKKETKRLKVAFTMLEGSKGTTYKIDQEFVTIKNGDTEFSVPRKIIKDVSKDLNELIEAF